MDKPDDFAYFQNGLNEAEGIDDAKDFELTVEAMTLIGFSDEEISNIFRAIAGVAHLGNVQFDETSPSSAQVTDQGCII